MIAESVEPKSLLERLYAKYNHRSFVPPDPLQFVYRYPDPRDAEIVAFLAAALAYGRVAQIHRSLGNLFGRMGRGRRNEHREDDGHDRRVRDERHERHRERAARAVPRRLGEQVRLEGARLRGGAEAQGEALHEEEHGRPIGA